MNIADLFVSTDVGLLDREWIRKNIKIAYWGSWRSDAIIDTSLANSLCLGLYWRDPETGGPNHPEQCTQLGFCRFVTDSATFAWLADVIVDPDHRGKGYGKFMVSQALLLPQVKSLAIYLGTRDAHSLYEKFGFNRLETMRKLPRP